MLPRLEHLCLQYLASFISLENVLNALQYAHSLNLEKIKVGEGVLVVARCLRSWEVGVDGEWVLRKVLRMGSFGGGG